MITIILKIPIDHLMRIRFMMKNMALETTEVEEEVLLAKLPVGLLPVQ